MGQEVTRAGAATAAVLLLWLCGLAGGGLLDLWLAASGRRTISDRVWAGDAALGAVVVAWMLAGPAFTAGHFWLGWFRPEVLP